MRILHKVFCALHPRIVYVLLFPILLFAPQLLSFIIGNRRESRYLPRLAERLPLTNNPLDDFEFINLNALEHDEVNLLFRGETLDHQEIDKSLPSFFLNATDITDCSEYKHKWLATADILALSQSIGLSSGMKPFDESNPFTKRKLPRDSALYARKTNDWGLYFVACPAYLSNPPTEPASYSPLSPVHDSVNNKLAIINNITLNDSRRSDLFNTFYEASVVEHKSAVPNIQLGSGIVVLVSLLRVARKVNIYGWDQYLCEELPSHMFGHVKALVGNRTSYLGTTITSLMNWIYAYRFMTNLSNRVKVSGRISSVLRLSWIPKRAYKIIYNC